MNRNEQEFIVQKIRTQYTEKEYTQLDELKKLDRKAKRPAEVFAYIFGSIAALIAGAGMSLVMTDIGATLGIANTMTTGIVTGIIGFALAIINYPLFKAIMNSRRKKFAGKIIALSDRLIDKQ